MKLKKVVKVEPRTLSKYGGSYWALLTADGDEVDSLNVTAFSRHDAELFRKGYNEAASRTEEPDFHADMFYEEGK